MTTDELAAAVPLGSQVAMPETAEDLELLLLIRRFEERLLELFAAGEVSGTTHTCIGQEHVPVALAPLLVGDFVVSNHRGHGHYLAHCGDVWALLAEILGREGALNGGFGGSQHLRQPLFMSTGVQGESVPLATGIALHYAETREPRVAAVYVGDGTWGEGAVYEGLNMASLWHLPLLVVVEHNGIAQSTPTADELAGTLRGRAAAFDVGYDELSTRSLAEIRSVAGRALKRVRYDHRPHVLVLRTDRLAAHSKGDDTRSEEELAGLRARDWLVELTERRPQDVARADRIARATVDEVTRTVLAAPPSSGSTP